MKKIGKNSLIVVGVVLLGALLLGVLLSKRRGVEGFEYSYPSGEIINGWNVPKPAPVKSRQKDQACAFNFECLSQNCVKGKCALAIKCNSDKDCKADTSKCTKEFGLNYDYNCMNRNKNKCVNNVCTSITPKGCKDLAKVFDGQKECCSDVIGDLGCDGNYDGT